MLSLTAAKSKQLIGTFFQLTLGAIGWKSTIIAAMAGT